MKCTCPACGSAFDLDAAVSDADARRFAKLVAGIHPTIAVPLIHYLALFKPEKTGMRWSRMLSLAQELEPMIRDAKITRNGSIYAAPAELWAHALAQLAERPANLRLPLKSHGYLLEMIASQAEKAAAKNEAQTEERKRFSPEGSRVGMSAPTDHLEKARQASLENFRRTEEAHKK